MKYLFWIVLFVLVPISMIVSEVRAEEENYLDKEYTCPTDTSEYLKRGEQFETDISRRMKKLYLTVPLGIRLGCEKMGWVEWKFVEFKNYRNDEPTSYVLKYLSREDFDKWEKGEFIFDMKLRAELVFCHKHKRASHLRYFEDGVERIINLHERTGGA